MLVRILAGLLIVGGAALAAPVAAQTLDKVHQRGAIIVGVKADYKPFGFRDPSGNIVGFEPDLAKEVADKIGVKLELEPVVSSNRMQFLQQGKIDLMIATMNDTEERRKVVGIVQPSYYASGITVLTAKISGLKNWDDVKGKQICGIQGAWYNKTVSEKYGAEIVAFKGTAEAQTALLQNNCVGWLYDNTAFPGILADTATWGGYAAPLPVIEEQPWGVAVPLPELDQAYGKLIAGMLEDWHKTGRLIELEKKWGLPASPWLAETHTKFKGS
jgi:polar amino acid transport system substrate-binding protein